MPIQWCVNQQSLSRAVHSNISSKVVANTIAALSDIHFASVAAGSEEGLFTIDSSILQKLLIALNECSEWGRVAILNALARYDAIDERESEHICERVVPQFQHANGSVVLAAIKVSPYHICRTPLTHEMF